VSDGKSKITFNDKNSVSIFHDVTIKIPCYVGCLIRLEDRLPITVDNLNQIQWENRICEATSPL
jgi:hypothetical protein